MTVDAAGADQSDRPEVTSSASTPRRGLRAHLVRRRDTYLPSPSSLPYAGLPSRRRQAIAAQPPPVGSDWISSSLARFVAATCIAGSTVKDLHVMEAGHAGLTFGFDLVEPEPTRRRGLV